MFTFLFYNIQLMSGHCMCPEVTAHICNVCVASEWSLEVSGGSLLTSLMCSASEWTLEGLELHCSHL